MLFLLKRNPLHPCLNGIKGAAASENLYTGTLDVSTAFSHSRLPKGIRANIRLPADIWP